MVKQLNLIENAVNPAFARHETFHPRFGWLKKGFDGAKKDPEIFSKEDAPIRLGVGKNMVRSMRYWCNAFKILEGDSPSGFGMNLLASRGWDEFLEDPASLWLLHWNLLKPTCEAAAWYFTFYIFRKVEFSMDELFETICKYRDSLGSRIVDASLQKDITCILRMYVEQGSKNRPSEDSIDCPFTELGLIQQAAGDTKRYTFNTAPKANLPAEIIVAACLEFAKSKGEQKTISISSLTFDPGSPGLAFKISERTICDAIEQVERELGNLILSESSGLIQFSFKKDPEELAHSILDNYYK
ncbi:DUF4007 family protein [Limnofasciculus baicalensis]|uniref:DUF4007 family protein n=1 Tax=Limnofasciculus baicalensis BBK-W-15 TaxID=2699891 RepID=A0AAE3GU28_9CYAN|nr:DUF4007 family protein [Limnofasciculus baicalensis]MCP2729893.1 DUF4007 family protein [Limnofasciculus baicalensis BBK-W-15]